MKTLIHFQRVKSLRKVKREKLSKFTKAAEAEAEGRETWILGFLQDRDGFPKTWWLGEVMGDPGGELLFPFNSGPGK